LSWDFSLSPSLYDDDNDGCVDWKPLYQPSKEQEDEDRKKAYETGVPHGYVPRGFRYEGMPTIKLTVQSELHTEKEYGSKRDQNGKHSGGPFTIDVSPKMTIEDLRLVIKVSEQERPEWQALRRSLHDRRLAQNDHRGPKTCD